MLHSTLFAFIGISSPAAYIVLGIVAIILFGNRLPSVMRSLGRSVVEFKKGVAGIEDDVDSTAPISSEKPKVTAVNENSEA